MRSRYGLLLLALIAQAASALATIEFMRMDISGQLDVVRPLTVKFLERGYKNIPSNEYKLVAAIKKLALEKGYTFQNIEDVAIEAATGLGMTR